MKKLVILAFATAVAFATPHGAFAKKAAASPTPAAAASPAEKSTKALGFHGTITAVDQSAKTFTIGKTSIRIYTVTDDTKLEKRSGGAATWSDLVVGAYVTGSGWKKSESTGADGKKVTHYEAKKVKVGEKTAAASTAEATPDASATPKAKRTRHAKATPTPAAAQ